MIEEKEPETTEEPAMCGVCYTELNSDNTVNTNCNHKFHRKCIIKWKSINDTCPLCRAKLIIPINKTYCNNCNHKYCHKDYKVFMNRYYCGSLGICCKCYFNPDNHKLAEAVFPTYNS